MPQKMLVGDKDTVLLIPAFELLGIPYAANPAAPTAPQAINAITSSLLNTFIPITSPGATANAKWGGNITCAIVDDWKLGQKDSSTKDIKTICSVGQSSELTFYNYDAQMNFLRDLNPADTTSEFNLAATLTQAPDVPYIVAHRLGKSRTTAAASGEEWNFYYVWTDIPIPTFADGDFQTIGETFISKGLLNFKAVLAS